MGATAPAPAARNAVRPAAVDAFQPAARAGAPAAQATPWAFRGGPNTEIGRTIQAMVDRARTSDVRIGGQSVEGLLTRSIFANPNITNEQIMAMSRLRPEQVASSPDAQRRTLAEIPNARELPSHRFTVDLLHAATGIDRATLSRNGPDLGMTGSADRVWPFTDTPVVLHAPASDRERLSTSLHDFTDTMRTVGISGVNQAVWGREGQVTSALLSTRGVPREFLNPSGDR
jgi:hypothetical protein